MLAGLSTFARNWRPPSGRRRELWDTSWFLFGIGFVGYVLTMPPPFVSDALSAPLRVVSETQLGWLVTGCAAFGIVVSYLPGERWLELGYRVPRTAALFMAINFIAGMALVALDGFEVPVIDVAVNTIIPDLQSGQAQQVLRAGFIYALLFGWATRRLGRDNRAWWEC